LFTDARSSVIQNWSPFNHQPPLPSVSTQPFNVATSLPFLTSIVAGEPIHASSSYAPSLPPMSHTPSKRMIGTIYHQAGSSDYIFKCPSSRCKHKAFTRWYDLRRHYDGTHANNGPVFWCQVHGCERSDLEGGRPFPRKDKLSDHVRKVHEKSDVWEGF
jgi:hypothetical protein